MNIKHVEQTFNRAKAAQKAGQHLLAARLFLAAQTGARQCRSARRVHIWDYAHAGASVQAGIVLSTCDGHGARSEAGRIRRESQTSYMGGLQ